MLQSAVKRSLDSASAREDTDESATKAARKNKQDTAATAARAQPSNRDREHKLQAENERLAHELETLRYVAMRLGCGAHWFCLLGSAQAVSQRAQQAAVSATGFSSNTATGYSWPPGYGDWAQPPVQVQHPVHFQQFAPQVPYQQYHYPQYAPPMQPQAHTQW